MSLNEAPFSELRFIVNAEPVDGGLMSVLDIPLSHAEAMFCRPARQHAQVAPIFKATALRR